MCDDNFKAEIHEISCKCYLHLEDRSVWTETLSKGVTEVVGLDLSLLFRMFGRKDL